MYKIICNVAEAKKQFHDYRSILDYIYSRLMHAECEYVAQNGKNLIGSFKDKKEIIYDGFCENCIGILNGHEVLLNNDLDKCAEKHARSLASPYESALIF